VVEVVTDVELGVVLVVRLVESDGSGRVVMGETMLAVDVVVGRSVDDLSLAVVENDRGRLVGCVLKVVLRETRLGRDVVHLHIGRPYSLVGRFVEDTHLGVGEGSGGGGGGRLVVDVDVEVGFGETKEGVILHDGRLHGRMGRLVVDVGVGGGVGKMVEEMLQGGAGVILCVPFPGLGFDKILCRLVERRLGEKVVVDDEGGGDGEEDGEVGREVVRDDHDVVVVLVTGVGVTMGGEDGGEVGRMEVEVDVVVVTGVGVTMGGEDGGEVGRMEVLVVKVTVGGDVEEDNFSTTFDPTLDGHKKSLAIPPRINKTATEQKLTTINPLIKIAPTSKALRRQDGRCRSCSVGEVG